MLGFDTATSSTAVALRLSDETTLTVRDDPGSEERPGHATRLLAMIAELLAEAGVGWSELDRIAVGVGPGRFTGLRVGIATARGLAQSLSLELVGVSSLWALAQAVTKGVAETWEERVPGGGDARAFGESIGIHAREGVGVSTGVLAAIDARRDEVFVAAYAPGGRSSADRELACDRKPVSQRESVSQRGLALPRELLAAQALAPGDLGKVPAETAAGGGSTRNWIAVGDGAVLYRDELEALEMRVPEEDSPLHLISGESICEIAVGLPASETIDMVLPDYRRRPDAEIALERAGGAGGARA